MKLDDPSFKGHLHEALTPLPKS